MPGEPCLGKCQEGDGVATSQQGRQHLCGTLEMLLLRSRYGFNPRPALTPRAPRHGSPVKTGDSLDLGLVLMHAEPSKSHFL